MQLLNFQTGIDFGVRGNLKEFSPSGFSSMPDEVSTWTEAPLAELIFRLPPLRHDLRFKLEVFPFLGGGAVPKQECWTFFNGLFVSYASFDVSGEITFAIARETVNLRANRLSFALPSAASPNELGIGNDLRKLGLAFVKLQAGPA